MRLPLLAVLLLTMSCAASQTSPAEPWRVEVTTSGGIAGRGVGTYAVDSAGEVTVVSMSGRRCSFHATAEELSGVVSAVAAARSESWNASYAPENRCCDRIEYVLTLTQGGVERKSEWIDDPLPRPSDLVALSDALIGGEGSVRVRYQDQCR